MTPFSVSISKHLRQLVAESFTGDQQFDEAKQSQLLVQGDANLRKETVAAMAERVCWLNGGI